MAKIKFTDYGLNIALMDVTLGKEYEITRFLDEGDLSHTGKVVPPDMPGVEFVDDVGDFVSYAFGYSGSKHEIIFDQVH